MRRGLLFFTVTSLLFPNLIQAWSGKTHIAIAYLAYKKLNHNAKSRVDEILVLHPLYSQWTKGAKLGQAGLLAFIQAAAWPGCIQTPACPGFREDEALAFPGSQDEWLNLGFADKLMHKDWHFVARPYAAEGVTTGDIPKPNLETQLPMLVDALNSNAVDSLKAYDLAWVANLVGELHQPLNCLSRYSSAHPQGDGNGRLVKLREAASAGNLHVYWDNLLGVEDDLASAVKEGKTLGVMGNEDVPWEPANLQKWLDAGADLARRDVYTPSVMAEDDRGNAVVLDAAYRKTALELALKQAAYAGNRLASLLNKNLR